MSSFVNINDFAGKTFEECKAMALEKGYKTDFVTNPSDDGFQAIWILMKDTADIVICDSPLEYGNALHAVVLYKNVWYDVDNGIEEDGSAAHCFGNYNPDNAGIEAPYAVVATWNEACLFTMNGKAYIVIENPDDPNKLDIFEKDETQENVQFALDTLLDGYGKPVYFCMDEDEDIPLLDRAVPIIKVFPGGEFIYTFGDEVYTDENGETKCFGEDNDDNVLEAVEYISDKHYQPVPLGTPLAKIS